MHEYFEQRGLSGPHLTGDDDEALPRLDAVTQTGKGLVIKRIGIKKARVGCDTERDIRKSKVLSVHNAYPRLEKTPFHL